MPRRSLIGLDIGSTSVKALELSEARDSLAITGLAVAEIPGPDRITETIREVLSKGKLRARRVVTAVSGPSVVVRYITVPQMKESELPAAIKFELGKYIPYSLEEVYHDYQKLEESSPGKPPAEKKEPERDLRILTVAVRKSIIDEHVKMLEGLGLVPHAVDVDLFALGNAFELRTRTNFPDRPPEVSAVVDIGANKTSVNILRGSFSFFTREIPVGGIEFTEDISRKLGLDKTQAEQIKRAPGTRSGELMEALTISIENLTNEIHLSFDYFENQFDLEVQSIYLSGGGALAPGIEEAFQKTFSKHPLRWDPTEGISVESDRVDPVELRQHSAQLPVAVGLAGRIREEVP